MTFFAFSVILILQNERIIYMKEKIINALVAFKWGYALLFAVLAALGVLSFCFYDMLKWVVFVAGAIVAAFGIGFGIFTFFSKKRGPIFVFRIIIFASAIVAGAITMIFHMHGIEVLTAVLGTLFIMDAACKLQRSAQCLRYKSAAWWILLVPAVLSAAGGFMLIKWGVAGADGDMTFVAITLGVTCIIDGLSNLLSAFLADGIKKAAENDKAQESADTASVGGESDDNTVNTADDTAPITEEPVGEADSAEASAEANASSVADAADAPEENPDTGNTDANTENEENSTETADGGSADEALDTDASQATAEPEIPDQSTDTEAQTPDSVSNNDEVETESTVTETPEDKND